ncbi:hypothetical protein [Winogradskyella bathintestinalis]|uniref:Lipoprotein n=1 Tax=Winogradskyella bathintestinalis TaxID=3035208 RepID=A0ABT7ZTE7_9FLAO|nr:hypothetical protein [Winogradskyella bathintestinalis]MDN3492270.1 hypothetical protein [Winogradskyella bathintestinalis]
MKTIVTILLLVLVMSCKTDNNKSKHTVVETEVNATTNNQLKLNNGIKWNANLETHHSMKRIASILNRETYSNAIILSDALSKETSFIIKNCDMKGKPHDQLHIVLLPILEEISAIKEEQTEIEFNRSIKKLQRLTDQYFSHFKYN